MHRMMRKALPWAALIVISAASIALVIRELLT